MQPLDTPERMISSDLCSSIAASSRAEMWGSIGGDSLQSANADKWVESVTDGDNWGIINYDKVVDITQSSLFPSSAKAALQALMATPEYREVFGPGLLHPSFSHPRKSWVHAHNARVRRCWCQQERWEKGLRAGGVICSSPLPPGGAGVQRKGLPRQSPYAVAG